MTDKKLHKFTWGNVSSTRSGTLSSNLGRYLLSDSGKDSLARSKLVLERKGTSPAMPSGKLRRAAR